MRTSKIRSLGKKSYFHEKFRHVFWLNVTFISYSPLKTNKELLKNCIIFYWSSIKITSRTNHPEIPLSTLI